MEFRRRLINGMRLSAFVTVSALVLTANFIGIIAAFAGEVENIGVRVHWYILVASIVFVVTILLLEKNGLDGKSIIITAPIIAIGSFVLILFGFEGVVHTLENPEAIFYSRVILYFVAAGLVATGLGYWGVRHWREFVGEGNSL